MSNENNSNLTEMIREIHDGVAKEMCCKGIDYMLNEISIYRMYDDYGNVADALQIAEELKAGGIE